MPLEAIADTEVSRTENPTIMNLRGDRLHWLRGNPENPNKALLILQQLAPYDSCVSYEFYNNISTYISSLKGSLKKTGSFSKGASDVGAMLVDSYIGLDEFLDSSPTDMFEHFYKNSLGRDGKYNLNIVFVPYFAKAKIEVHNILVKHVHVNSRKPELYSLGN